MQYASVFGMVYFFPAEHGFDGIRHPALPGQFQQQGQGPIGDYVLGIIKEDIPGGEGKFPETIRILRKQLAHAGLFHINSKMILQLLPGFGLNGGEMGKHKKSELKFIMGEHSGKRVLEPEPLAGSSQVLYNVQGLIHHGRRNIQVGHEAQLRR